MKKISSLILVFSCMGLLLSGCSGQKNMSNNNGTQQTTNTQAVVPTPNPAPPIKIKDVSGIRGLASVGPACPVEKTPPDPKCAEKPYMGAFNVSTVEGKLIKTFNTRMDGRFDFEIPSGTYVVALTDGKDLPHMDPRTITVKNDKYTSIMLQLES